MRRYQIKHESHEANSYTFNGSLQQFEQALWPDGTPSGYTVTEVVDAEPEQTETPKPKAVSRRTKKGEAK